MNTVLRRFGRRALTVTLITLAAVLLAGEAAFAQPEPAVTAVNDENGSVLLVDGRAYARQTASVARRTIDRVRKADAAAAEKGGQS